jgi:LacI family transcriptional regulator
MDSAASDSAASAVSMVSMKEVSRRAQVSISTVSHVLNKTRHVSPSLRQRVEAAVAELGYRQNGLARSLRTRQSYTLGLVIPDVSNPYYPQLARGVQDAADAAGYSVFLCNSDRRAANEVRLLLALEQRRVDGIILDASGPDAALLDALHRRTFPLVLVGSRIDAAGFDTVKMASHGGYDAVRYLLSRGHRRIGLIGGPPVPASDRLAKAGGYLLALSEAGIAAEMALMVEGDYTREGGRTAMERLLAVEPPVTAVFAGNDLMAIGAMAAARAAGLSLPGEMAVVGYDDIPEAAVTSPALTTVAVPKYDMGRLAAELLLQRIAEQADHGAALAAGDGDVRPVATRPRVVELPHHLVERASA